MAIYLYKGEPHRDTKGAINPSTPFSEAEFNAAKQRLDQDEQYALSGECHYVGPEREYICFNPLRHYVQLQKVRSKTLDILLREIQPGFFIDESKCEKTLEWKPISELRI